jgi:hypothetical protein
MELCASILTLRNNKKKRLTVVNTDFEVIASIPLEALPGK